MCLILEFPRYGGIRRYQVHNIGKFSELVSNLFSSSPPPSIRGSFTFPAVYHDYLPQKANSGHGKYKRYREQKSVTSIGIASQKKIIAR